MTIARVRQVFFLLLAGLTLSMLATPELLAQATAAVGQGISGSVVDPSGASVPGAEVAVVNTDTGATYTTHTGEGGFFSFPGLVIGPYQITVTKSGFESSVRKGIIIVAGVTPDVVFQLKVGASTETVTVSGEAGTIDKTDSTSGEAIVKEQLQDLPILSSGGTRSPMSYITAFAGVSPTLITSGGVGGPGTLGQSIIYGAGDAGQMSGESYLVDGVNQAPYQASPFSGSSTLMPSPADIQEVHLLTNLDADQGFNLGAVFEIVTKSGTEQYHGEVYEYLRNNALDATNFLATSKSPEKQHDFGVTFGGPIPFANKKQFFFVNYSGYRSAFSSNTGYVQVPTAKMRTGDFSELLGGPIGTDGSGQTIYAGEIFDPTTTHSDGHGGLTRDPFPGNVVPTNRLSPVSLFFQKAYPLPNLPGVQGNYVANALPSNTEQDKLYIKTDHSFGDRQRLSLAYEDFMRNGTGSSCGSFLGGGGTSNSGFAGFGDLINSCAVDNVKEQNFRLNYVFTFRPNVLFAFNAGLAYNPYGVALDSTGLTGGTQAGIKGTFTGGTPEVDITEAAGYGQATTRSSGFGQGYNRETGEEFIIPFDASVSWIRNLHQFKFGTQFNHVVNAPIDQYYSNGQFEFDGGGTYDPDFTAGGSTTQPGYGWADFLLGWVDSAHEQSPFAIRTTSDQWAWYAQDQWRATTKLTINMGFRWELYLPATETGDKWADFCPTCPNPGAGGIPGATVFLGSGPGRLGRRTEMNIYPWAIAPRLGIAYALTESNVIRLYWGVMRFPLNILQGNGINYPDEGFGTNLSLATTNNGVTPIFSDWDNGTFSPPPPTLSSTIDNGGSPAYYNFNENHSHPQQAMGVTFEHQFPRGWIASATYNAKVLKGLPSGYLSNLNQLPLKYLSLGPLLNESITSPDAVAAGIPIPYSGFTGSVLQALLPFPQYGGIPENDALIKNMFWQAAMFDVRQRFTSGFSFLANLTLSSDISNDPFTYNGGDGFSIRQNDSLPFTYMPIASGDQAGERKHVENFTLNYELPVGRGRRFAVNNGALDAVVGGWNVAGLLNFGSGIYEPIIASTGVSTLQIWAVRNPGVNPAGNATCKTYTPANPNLNYLNPAAWGNPAAYTLGNVLMETQKSSCGYNLENLALSKEFRLWNESSKFKLGADASNAFNAHFWDNLDPVIATPGFGRYNAVSPARAIQVHAQIIF